uniref:Uncharacterized protein n=1 Tax=Thermosphaera aggregans TaxID=54254 RepID=A0A7C2G0W8_9CREN
MLPEPYSYTLPDPPESKRVDLAEEALRKVYKNIKERVEALTKNYKNPVYINARTIASSTLFYILVSEGVKRILYYDPNKPDPQLAFLFSINDGFVEFYQNWDSHLG